MDIFNFFKNRKAKKEKEELERIASHNEYIESLEKSIKDSTDKMLNKPCAILGMKHCTDKCIHFEQGYVATLHFPDFRGGEYSVMRYPKCKLWRDA